MPALEQLIFNPAVLAALAAVAMGSFALWANPGRMINRVFFSGSLHVAAWLMCLEMALFGDDGLYWVRMASAVGAFLPAHLWVVKEMVRRSPDSWHPRRWWPWAVVGGLLAWLAFTYWFVPAHSTPEVRVYGWGYFAYMGGVITLYVILLLQTLLQARHTAGVERLELQVLLLGGTTACVTVIGLMVANAITHNSAYIFMQPVIVLIFYGGTAWVMLTARVFDARHMLFLGLQKLFLALAAALFIWSANELIVMLVPQPLAFLIAVGLGLWFAAEAGPWFQQVFDLNLQGEDARRAAFEAARRESKPERLEQSFVLLLRSWAKAERAYVLTGAEGQLRGGGLTLPADGSVVQALGRLRWVTPERLARQRQESHERELQLFMEREQLGVMVACGGQSLSVVLAVGVPLTRRPFTYPQVAQLVELASIIESALERSHYSVKAQRAEQLATVGLLGASLAHEIRNPLVTIKTFVQLLPQHYQDPVFREKFFRLIGEEVARIDRLTEQLLDLATPRAYLADNLELHPVLRASLELVEAKAEDRQIRVLTDFRAAPDRVQTDATAVKQVILNLCFNALQAVEALPGSHWVRVSTRNLPGGVEVAIEDSGHGIAPDMVPRLFQPFQSTKSTGFGLGLAICSDILTGLKATITVDPPVAGRGATFRVTFPCPA
ncbi:MAG TPA: ATP-binding protein [Opitutaceae bacterium]|nr:ATP-binding protein [Opitutaceae bacterium]